MEYIKILKIADVREVLDKLGREEITYSKMVELLNIKINEQLAIYGVVKPLNFNINKDLKIKSLGDLKRAYPDNHSHRVSSFGGCINYFVDGQLVYERKI
jgi:hypothetical protein